MKRAYIAMLDRYGYYYLMIKDYYSKEDLENIKSQFSLSDRVIFNEPEEAYDFISNMNML